MGRIALALSVAVSIWLGSALSVDAQTIVPTGPPACIAGSPTTNFTGTVTLPLLCPYKLSLKIMRGTEELHSSETQYPKPSTLISTLSKTATLNTYVNTGDVLVFLSSIKVGTVWYPGIPWTVTVTTSRPPKTDSYQKRSTLAIQSVDRDRRRE